MAIRQDRFVTTIHVVAGVAIRSRLSKSPHLKGDDCESVEHLGTCPRVLMQVVDQRHLDTPLILDIEALFGSHSASRTLRESRELLGF